MWRHLVRSWTYFASHLCWVALRLQRVCRVGSKIATVDLHLGTIPTSAACHIRSWVKPWSLSAITFTCRRQSRVCTRVTFRKASGGSQGRARTCQVKKGMSPSCKHFLSGREHFLNPGTTTSVAYSPANSRQWLSLSTSQLHRQLILTVQAYSCCNWEISPMWVALEQTKNDFLCSLHIIKGKSGGPAKKK